MNGLSKREEIAARVIGSVISEWHRDGEVQHTVLHQMKMGKNMYRAWAAAAVELADALIHETGGITDPRENHRIERLRRFGNRYTPALKSLGITTVGELAKKQPEEIVVPKKLAFSRAMWVIQEAQDYLEAAQ